MSDVTLYIPSDKALDTRGMWNVSRRLGRKHKTFVYGYLTCKKTQSPTNLPQACA